MISVLIVHYNRADLLKDCLESIKSAKDVVVVDNGSLTTAEQEWFSQNFPNVSWVFLKDNLGFSAGINHAARRAKGDVFLLLNPDTSWRGHCFEALERSFWGNAADIMGIRQVTGTGKLQLSIGWKPTVLAEAFRKVLQDSLDADASWADGILGVVQADARSVAWVAGSALLTTRSLFEQLRGFDERYFLYFEDIDYCLRAAKRGAKVVYIDAFETLHHRGACATTAEAASRQHYRDSQELFFREHGQGLARYALPLWSRVRKLLKP